MERVAFILPRGVQNAIFISNSNLYPDNGGSGDPGDTGGRLLYVKPSRACIVYIAYYYRQ